MTVGRVLVVDDTKLIPQLIHDQLTKMGYQVTEAYDGAEALRKVKSFNPDLIILDIMLPGADGFQIARTVRQDSAHLHTPIILLSSKSELDAKVAGFEAGADDYLTKPFDPTELELRVRALLARAHGARRAPAAAVGKVITVFSLRGGSGVTSIAVNLAVGLAQLLDQEIPLVDLSLETSGAGVLLDLTPRRTLLNLAKEDVSVLDPGLIREYLAPHPSRVRLLAAPPGPIHAELVTPGLVTQILSALRGSFSHVVVDAPHTLAEYTLAALDSSDVILLVTPPDLVSLKAATAALETFAMLDYPESRTAVLINSVFGRRGLSQKEIETALKRPVLAVLPHEPEALAHAINEGVPLALNQPALHWAQALENLAFGLATPESKLHAEAAGSRRFALLKKRLPA
jgi:pilus assembly protein CpaE